MQIEVITSTTRWRPASRRCCDHHKHSFATAALCCCSFTNAFLVISVFPYAGYMVLDLDPNATTENAGLYAGLIASSFFGARFLTAYQWGRVADLWGRTLTLKLALTLSTVFSILFGLSKSLYTAILWRACLGMSNGIISTTKTVATEIAIDNNEKLQRRTMGLVIGMRSWGLLIAPGIAGFLAEPIQQYPALFDKASSTFLQTPWIIHTLETFPFLLPNLFGAGCCLTAVAAIHFFLPETLLKEELDDVETPLTDPDRQQKKTSVPTLSTESEHKPLLEKQVEPMDSSECAQQSIWGRPLTRSHMIAHWMFSFVSTYVDESFPLFCMSVTGGMALKEADIGMIMSGAGLFFAVLQYATFASITHKFGLYRALTIGCLLGSIPAAFMPLALLLRRHKNSWSMVFLSCLMGFTKLMHSLNFTSMAVAINKTVDSSQRARMNALVLTGNSIGKALGPAFAGSLVTFSFSSMVFPARYGSLLVWSMVPVMGLRVAFRIRRLRQQVASGER